MRGLPPTQTISDPARAVAVSQMQYALTPHIIHDLILNPFHSPRVIEYLCAPSPGSWLVPIPGTATLYMHGQKHAAV